MTTKTKEILFSETELNKGLKYLLMKYKSREVTATKIIFKYAVWYNETYIKTAATTNNKPLYISLIESFLNELNKNGFYVGSDWKNNELLPLKKGNSKLEKTILIFNTGSAIFCTSKNRNLCKVCGFCYAANSERQYLGSLIYRLTQTIRFNKLTAEQIAEQILRKRSKIDYIRVNEAGDLFNKEDIKKIKKISEIIYLKKGIITYLYTAAGPEYKQHQTLYLKINISGSDYTAKPNLTNDNTINKLVCCGDCSFCLWCKHEFNNEIINKYHGSSIPEGTGHDQRTGGVKYYHKYTRLLCWYQYQQIKETGSVGGVY